MLPSEVPRLITESPVRMFPGVWILKDSLPGLDLHRYLHCPSFYLLHFFLPPLEDNGLFSGYLTSSACIQKFICGIYSVFKCSFDEFVEGEIGLPVLVFSHHRTAPEISHNSHEITRALKTMLPC